MSEETPMNVVPMSTYISLRMEVEVSMIETVDGKETGSAKFFVVSKGADCTIKAKVGDQVLYRPTPMDFTYGDQPVSVRRVLVPETAILAVLK